MILDPKADYTGKDGADLLAQRIREYWRARGKFVKVYAFRDRSGNSDRFDVRSDMIGGQP